jgi:2-keto-4-pentenoate hydratase/2-oxohepta-3-ene-1,7-dioic acid hydratase in catechol pathway
VNQPPPTDEITDYASKQNNREAGVAMKYCRFLTDDGPKFGVVEQRDGENWITELVKPPSQTDDPETLALPAVRLSELSLLAPVTPSKIVCVGRNYRDHAKELGNEVPTEPLLFFKPPSSLLASGAPVLLPAISQRIDFEGELAIVIGKRARKLNRTEDIRPYIHGLTLANDVTARDLQKKEGQWTRGKGFDTFCPVGPFIETALDPLAPLAITTHVNGEIRQQGNTRDFIFSLPELFEYITAAMTLEPGDLLLTGTPAGVGPLAAGDVVDVSIQEIGQLSNPVQSDAD